MKKTKGKREKKRGFKMHELSITKTLINNIKKECNEKKINPKKIFVELGELTNYKKEPLLFYYDLLKKEDGILQNTILEIKEVKAKVFCNQCKKESNIITPIMMFCGECDSQDIKVLEGREFKITNINY